MNMFGDDSEEVTPVPIPNTEVKLFSADGSWRLSSCESRTLPSEKRVAEMLLLFVLKKYFEFS